MNLWRCVSFYFRYTNCVKIQRVRNYRNLIFNRCTMAGKILYILQQFRISEVVYMTIILWWGKFCFYYRGSEFPAIETATVALWRDIQYILQRYSVPPAIAFTTAENQRWRRFNVSWEHHTCFIFRVSSPADITLPINAIFYLIHLHGKNVIPANAALNPSFRERKISSVGTMKQSTR